MTDRNEVINQWLRDAHAMEKQAEKMLTAQAERLEHYPELRERIRQHIEETRSQSDQLSRCLEARGTSASGMKDVLGQMTAMFQGLGGIFASDEVVKGALAGYVFEHMEIASYRILIEAARSEGDEATAQTCEAICREEEAMAAWLAEHMPEVTRTYLSREAAELEEAKR
mgnify:CR=1 FL=1|jgi:Uncharacterized protein conserved in bacteria